MAKAILKLNYKEYVMTPEDALHILNLIMGKAERYETTYASGSRTKTYHVYDIPLEEKTEHLEIVADDLYRMAKLAGRPTKT